MARVTLICGKLCSGKSTYAESLRRETGAVLLSVDEIMLPLFGLYAGEKHDEYAEKTKTYLYDKSVEILRAGADVILDWGFWRRDERAAAKAFYGARGIPCAFHYLDVSDGIWRERIEKRNREIAAGETVAYPVDDALAAKFASRFEAPDREEIDVWVTG